MFTLTHEGDHVGTTKLERGDPSLHSVSGLFNNVGGVAALVGWLKSIGGEEDDGVVFIELNKDFVLLDQTGAAIAFESGHLIAVPADDEAFLDLTGLSDTDYKQYFADHISAMESDK
jgi:hypothetical protein